MSGIIGSVQNLGEGWKRCAERGGNRGRKPSWLQTKEKCLLCFLLSAEAHHVAHRSRECLRHAYEAILDFVTCLVTGEQPVAEVGVLRFTPLQCLTPQLGATAGSCRLWFTEWSAKGLNCGLKFPKVFLVCLKYLCLQQFRPVYVSFSACWVKSSLAFTMCLYTGF